MSAHRIRACETGAGHVVVPCALGTHACAVPWQGVRCNCRDLASAAVISRNDSVEFINSPQLTFKERKMPVSTRDQVSDPQDTVVSPNGDAKLRHTMAVLEELLAQSIYLRDLYRSARWQTAAIQYRRLHQL